MFTSKMKTYVSGGFWGYYKELLETKIYKNKEMADAWAGDAQIKQAFMELTNTYFSCLENFYRKNPKANYVQEVDCVYEHAPLKKALKKYVSLTNDSTVFTYLQVYSYCAQEIGEMLNEGNVAQYLSLIKRTSLNMHNTLNKDIVEKNFWWLKDSPNTLRRQLKEQCMVINYRRFRAMCEKYLPSGMNNLEIDHKRKRIIEKKGAGSTVQELDEYMLTTYNVTPHFCWRERNAQGELVVKYSTNPPPNGEYSFKIYQNPNIAKEQSK